MNKNDKLQNSFKKAFEDHQEPLHQAQWERLDRALDEKPLTRKWKWFYLLGVFCLTALSFMTGYFLRSEKESKLTDVPAQMAPANDNTANTTDNTTTTPGTSANNTAPTQTPATAKTNENNTASGQVNKTNNTNNTNTNENKKPSQSSVSDNKQPGTGQTPKAQGNDKSNQTGDVATDNKGTSPNKPATEQGSKPAVNTSGLPKDKIADKQNADDKNIVTDDSKAADKHDVITTDDKTATPSAEKDTPVIKPPAIAHAEPADSMNGGKKNGKDKEDNGASGRPKFAFTFSSGVSAVKTSIVSFSNPGSMHKDTRQLFDQSNTDKSSVFVNLGFEWYPFKRLSLIFNSGLQYRQFSTHENFEYKYNEVPWRNADQSIDFYIHIHDTSGPIVFKSNNKQRISYVNVPLSLGYSFALSPKHEMGFVFGANISMISGVKGNTFSLNDVEEKPLKSLIGKKVNIGPIGGLNYTYNIYRSFWMGGELQWQRNNTTFETQYGSYRARYGANNYNLIFRYKF